MITRSGTLRRLFMFLALAATAVVICVCGRARREPTTVEGSSVASSAATELTVIAVERMLHQLESAKLGYTRKEICFSTNDPVSFEEPDPRTLAAVRGVETAIIPANRCGYGKEIGRIVEQVTGDPRVLLFTRAYLYDGSDRAFVLGGWYEHTMSARRYLFIFRRVGEDWKLEDAMRLGAV